MDYYSKYLKYKRKYLQLKMELASNNLNVDDTAVIKGGSNNIFIPSEANLGLPDVLPDTLNSSDNLTEFDNYLKGGDNCGSKDENHMNGGDNENNFAGGVCTPGKRFPAGDGCNTCTCPESGDIKDAFCTLMLCPPKEKEEKKITGGNNYKTPTDTPLTIFELNNTDEQTPNYTPETTTELSMEGGNKNTMTSPSSSEIFQSISKTE